MNKRIAERLQLLKFRDELEVLLRKYSVTIYCDDDANMGISYCVVATTNDGAEV